MGVQAQQGKENVSSQSQRTGIGVTEFEGEEASTQGWPGGGQLNVSTCGDAHSEAKGHKKEQPNII